MSAAFAAKAQEIAWKVAKSYPMSGVGTTDVAKPVNVRSAPAVLATRARIVDLAGRQVPKSTREFKGLTSGFDVMTLEHNGVNVSKTTIVR